MHALWGPLFSRKGGSGASRQANTVAGEEFLLPSIPHVWRIWPFPERKNRGPDCSPRTLCPDSCHHRQLGTAYVSATTGAVATALGLKSLTKVNALHVPFIHLPFPRLSSTPIHRLPTSLPRVPPIPWPLGPLSDIFPPPAPAPLGRQICALRRGGSCQLHQHPPDEAKVSGSRSGHARPHRWAQPSPSPNRSFWA